MGLKRWTGSHNQTPRTTAEDGGRLRLDDPVLAHELEDELNGLV